MPNTITNFLVGVGFDLDKKSASQVDGAIDTVGKKAIQLGAVLAGAFGVNTLTAGFAAVNNELGKFSQAFGVIPNEVASLGRVIEQEGGSMEGFMEQLSSLEKFRSGLLVGNAEFIAQAGKAGIDTSVITNAKDATQAYIALADQFQNMNQQQRINAADSLGLDRASIILLSKGSDEIERAMRAQQEMRPVTDDMIDAADRWNREWNDLSTNVGGFADQISIRLVPEINNVVSGLNEWIDANRELANQTTGDFLDGVSDNFVEIAGTLGLLSAGTGLSFFGKLASFIPVIGSGVASISAGLGGLLSKLGLVGVAITGVNIFKDPLTEIGETFLPKFMTTPIPELFGGADTIGAADGMPAMSDAFAPAGPARQSPFSLPVLPPIRLNVNIDGKVIDDRIIDINTQQNNQAIQDLATSTAG